MVQPRRSLARIRSRRSLRPADDHLLCSGCRRFTPRLEIDEQGFQLHFSNSPSSFVGRNPFQRALTTLLVVRCSFLHLDFVNFNHARRNVAVGEPFQVCVTTNRLFLDPATYARFLPCLNLGGLMGFLFFIGQPLGMTQRPLSREVMTSISMPSRSAACR